MTARSVTKILIVLAALMGASGVALAAYAAHRPSGGFITTASSMLLFHAPAVIAGCIAAASGTIALRIGLAATSLMTLGVILFSADLVMRDLAGTALFPMAAPTGGTTMILSWLVLAIAAIWKRD